MPSEVHGFDALTRALKDLSFPLAKSTLSELLGDLSLPSPRGPVQIRALLEHVPPEQFGSVGHVLGELRAALAHAKARPAPSGPARGQP